MATKVEPPLSNVEKSTIRWLVEALIARDRQKIAGFAKSRLYKDEVFWENVEYVDICPSDMPDDLFGDVVCLKQTDDTWSALLQVNLRDHKGKKNQIQITLERNEDGGGLRLNSIGDIEPEDYMGE